VSVRVFNVPLCAKIHRFCIYINNIILFKTIRQKESFLYHMFIQYFVQYLYHSFIVQITE